MNRRRRKTIYLLFIIIIFGAYYVFEKRDKAPSSQEYKVLDVLDGDTIIIEDAKNSRVRYLGIDTPEIALQDSPGEPMSKEATDFNAKLVEGEEVVLEFDQEKYDVYGRILAYVYVDDVLVNEELLKEGLATVLIIPPNDMHSEKIYSAITDAKRNKKGLWGELSGLNPPHQNRQFEVDLDKLPRYEGKRVVAVGKITDTRKSKKVIVLNMKDMLDVVIFPSDWDNFGHFDIDPEKFYKGKTIEVVGRVRMRRGKPSIVVNHPMLLRSQD